MVNGLFSISDFFDLLTQRKIPAEETAAAPAIPAAIAASLLSSSSSPESSASALTSLISLSSTLTASVPSSS